MRFVGIWLERTFGRVVLMAPIGVSRAIEIVFEEVDGSSDALVAEALFGSFGQLLENSLTGAIMNDRISRVVTFSSCIFGM
jgi:hypothetical protein